MSQIKNKMKTDRNFSLKLVSNVMEVAREFKTAHPNTALTKESWVDFATTLAGYSVNWGEVAGWFAGVVDATGESLGAIFDAARRSLLEEEGPNGERGIARNCSVCNCNPGMHKCCPSCTSTADGFDEVERVFGFRAIYGQYQVPQTWCRTCRCYPKKEDAHV